MGIYRRSRTSNAKKIYRIFLYRKRILNRITFYLETTNKIIRVRIRALSSSFFFFVFLFVIFPLLLLTILLPPLCHFLSFILLIFFYFLSFFVILSCHYSPSPPCFLIFSSLFYQSFFTFFSNYVLFIVHY